MFTDVLAFINLKYFRFLQCLEANMLSEMALQGIEQINKGYMHLPKEEVYLSFSLSVFRTGSRIEARQWSVARQIRPTPPGF